MAELDFAKRLLTKLRHVPNPTPAKLLAEFRRLVAAEEAKPRPKHEKPCVANSTDARRPPTYSRLQAARGSGREAASAAFPFERLGPAD